MRRFANNFGKYIFLRNIFGWSWNWRCLPRVSPVSVSFHNTLQHWIGFITPRFLIMSRFIDDNQLATRSIAKRKRNVFIKVLASNLFTPTYHSAGSAICAVCRGIFFFTRLYTVNVSPGSAECASLGRMTPVEWRRTKLDVLLVRWCVFWASFFVCLFWLLVFFFVLLCSIFAGTYAMRDRKIERAIRKNPLAG